MTQSVVGDGDYEVQYMTNRGQLAERLRQISEGELELVADTMKEQLQLLSKRLRKSVASELSTTEKDISSEIQQQREKIQKLLIIGWVKPIILGLMLTVGLAIGNWGVVRHYSHQIVDLSAQADQARATLNGLAARGIQLEQVSQGRYLVLPEGQAIVGGWEFNGRPAYRIEASQ
jgi:hypothetical protein